MALLLFLLCYRFGEIMQVMHWSCSCSMWWSNILLSHLLAFPLFCHMCVYIWHIAQRAYSNYMEPYGSTLWDHLLVHEEQDNIPAEIPQLFGWIKLEQYYDFSLSLSLLSVYELPSSGPLPGLYFFHPDTNRGLGHFLSFPYLGCSLFLLDCWSRFQFKSCH